MKIQLPRCSRCPHSALARQTYTKLSRSHHSQTRKRSRSIRGFLTQLRNAEERTLISTCSELPLEAELYLPCVRCFDQATVGVQAIIGADEYGVGVVG
jgi:hypothetical protein